MILQSRLVLALGLTGALSAAADTVYLRDKAAISGRILSEKADLVALDIGYTVLTIPRTEITRVARDETPATETLPGGGAKAEAAPVGFYASGAPRSQPGSVNALFATLGEAVVQIRTPGSLGSGFFVNEDGYLVTNFHVIEGETQLGVEVYHQRGGQVERKTYRQVRIVAMNKFADLALLRIEDKDAPKFKFVNLGTTDRLTVGDRVFAIGSPLGLERTVTEGILSTKTRQLGGELYLQTTTQINPGNSGGPLFSLSGEVVGVTNMKITFGEGLGFAIPVEAVRFFLDHRDAFAYANDHPSNAYRYLEPPSRTRPGVQRTD